EEYDTLSQIAPVVAYPETAWGTTWEDSLDLVGQALGRSEQAETVLAETEQTIEQTAQANPQLRDKTFVFASLSSADRSKLDVYAPTDNRVRLLTDLGMKNAPFVEQNAAQDAFFFSVSAEQAPQLDSDLFIAYTMQPGELETFRSDPLIGQIPALRDGGFVEASDQTAVLGLSAPSPLAIPYSMEHFVPEVAAAAGQS
ncbi:ABC transporter substrate-binding protein, partial [Micrococcus sp.]|uniref:ABC transporter substrate-binding protein n=1 Tax=Micrococcus sp. TaxID=1271 RepID=UPI0026DABFBB